MNTKKEPENNLYIHKFIKKNSGITLIQLIIIVIILLILAIISIRTVVGESGIIFRTSKVKNDYATSAEAEKEKLRNITNSLNDKIIPNPDNENYIDSNNVDNSETLVPDIEDSDTDIVYVIGNVASKKLSVDLKEEHRAKKIIIDWKDVTNFISSVVYPGFIQKGELIINNETGNKYKVTDYSFDCYFDGSMRVFNSAAKSKYGTDNAANRTIVKNLSASEWEALNSNYFGEKYFRDVNPEIPDLATFNQMLDGGNAIISETSEIMKNLAGLHFFINGASFTFNTATYPISSSGVPCNNTYIYDYVKKTSENQNIMLNSFFINTIDSGSLTFNIAHGLSGPNVGNAYNGNFSYEFDIQLTLTKID